MRNRIAGHRTFQLGAALALLAALVLGIVACGGQGAPQGTSSASNTKPTGAGTPVSGAPQTLTTVNTGLHETLITAQGVTYVGGDNGVVYAFRADTGALLWRHANASLSAVGASAVYVLSGNTLDTIEALRLSDGQPLWQRTISTVVGAGVLSLVVANDVIFASYELGSQQGVVAMRTSNGAQLWQWTGEIDQSEPITVADGLVFVQSIGGQSIYALDASHGTLRWSYPIAGRTTPPAAANGVMYVINGQTEVDAVQDATGQRLWRFTCDADQVLQTYATLSVVGGVVYAPASGRIYALRASDGARLWAADRADTTSGTPDQVVVGDGGVYSKEGDGGVVALRASDGARLWAKSVERSAMGLVEEQGRVDVATQNQVIYTLRASDGKLLWSQPIDNFGGWSPTRPAYIVVAGVVYVGTERGVVQAIRASDGHVLWRFTVPPITVPSQPVYSAAVTFASSVSYLSALRTVTDLGLQVVQPCVQYQGDWQPMNAQTNWPEQLLVSSTPIASPGWLRPLGKAASVTQVQPNPAYSCPLMGFPTTTPGAPQFLSASQVGTTARITFSAQTSYETALGLVSALGFRLGDPCYERLPQGAHVTWTPMGQESAYAKTHALLVVTTTLNSDQWQRQARASAGVTKVEASPTVTCGK